MSGRCTGQCCRCLDVGPPGELEGRIRLRLLSAPVDAPDLEDLRKIPAMLVYRGFGMNPQPRSDNSPRHWHTCRHLVESADGTASCDAYETRPAMCRAFPRGKCPYEDCTYEP